MAAKPIPKLDGVQWERVRKIVDAPFVRASWRLETAYYGQLVEDVPPQDRPALIRQYGTTKSGNRLKNGWKDGVNAVFHAAPGVRFRFNHRAGHAVRLDFVVDTWTPTNLPRITEPAQLFDLLHGRLWREHEVALAEQNERERPKDRYDDLDKEYDSDGNELPTKKSDRLRAELVAEKATENIDAKPSPEDDD